MKPGGFRETTFSRMGGAILALTPDCKVVLGSGWVRKDGSILVTLNVLPLDGRLVIKVRP